MELIDKYRKRVRGYAGLFAGLGAIQFAVGVAGLLAGDFLSFDDAFAYTLSGAFYIAGAVMAWNGARSGAVAILAWLIFNTVVELAWSDPGVTSLVRYLVFVVLAGLMTVNAFRHWHAVRSTEGGRIRGAAMLRWGGLAVVAPIAVVMGMGVSVMLAPMPVSERILPGSEIPADQVAWMQEQGYLFETETPLLFYSEGIASIAEGGNLLTDRFMGSWAQDDDGEVFVSWVRLGEICEITTLDDGQETGMGKYTIHPIEGRDTLEFWLPAGDTLHETFLERLDYLNGRHSNAELEAACAEERSVNWDRVARLNGVPVGIVEGDKLSRRVLNWLRGQEFLMTDEQPLWLFSTAKYELSESGALMTDAYFGGWWEDDGAVKATWFRHGEICTIETVEAETSETLVRYRVAGPGAQRYLSFSLPSEDASTPQRIADIQAVTDARQTAEQASACETGVDPLLIENEPVGDALPSAADTGEQET